MKKLSGLLAFILFLASLGFVGAVERSTIDWHSGILMSLVCLGGCGFFSWLSGAWYRV